MSAGFELRRELQEQRRLADPRLTADENHRPGHDAAAKDEIQLLHAGRPARELSAGDVPPPCRRADDATGGDAARRFESALARRCYRAFGDRLLDECIPFAARLAATRPLCGFSSAFRATVDRFCFGHA